MTTDTSSEKADQRPYIEVILEETPEAVLIPNLGEMSGTLIKHFDRQRNFYLTGAMGMAMSIGYGAAQSVDGPVTVLEGDGALLMSLGELATIGRYDPSNLTVVLFDNTVYSTTGGQATHSANTDFAAVAENCGVKAWEVDDVEEFADLYAEAQAYDGATFITCNVDPYSPEDVPDRLYAPAYTKYRLREALTGKEAGLD